VAIWERVRKKELVGGFKPTERVGQFAQGMGEG